MKVTSTKCIAECRKCITKCQKCCQMNKNKADMKECCKCCKCCIIICKAVCEMLKCDDTCDMTKRLCMLCVSCCKKCATQCAKFKNTKACKDCSIACKRCETACKKCGNSKTKSITKRGGSANAKINPVEMAAIPVDDATLKQCPECKKKSKLIFSKLDSHENGCRFKATVYELNKNGLETGFDEQRNVFYIRSSEKKGEPFIIPEVTIHDTSSDSDIMYEDDNVCILRPEVKKGILVFTNFNKSDDIEDLCTLGLKSAEQLQKEGVYFGRDVSVKHPYIFFRAPYYSTECDYSSIDTEIESSFESLLTPTTGGRIFIRVDPDKTFVYPSELRVICDNQRFSEEKKYTELNKAKKKMGDYLQMIEDVGDWTKKRIVFWNLLTYSYVEPDTVLHTRLMSLHTRERELPYPYDITSPLKNSEMLVQLPHLTPNYFVRCINF